MPVFTSIRLWVCDESSEEGADWTGAQLHGREAGPDAAMLVVDDGL